MAISQNFPEEGPTLNLNFAGSRTLDPRITFTRTSSATFMGRDGLVKIAPANSARFDHLYNPTTGEVESLGLLVEEQRSNLLLRSEEFDDASWNVASTPVAVTANTETSPSGNLTADTLANTGNANTEYRIVQFVTSSSQICFSVYVKEGTHQFLQFRTNNEASGFVNFDLSSISVSATTATGSILDAGFGWRRCSAVFAAASITSVQIQLVSGLGAVRAEVWTPTGTINIYIWGAQLEQGSFPTSYIPTTTSTATRTADNASITGSNFSDFYNPSEGTFNIKYNRSLLPIGPILGQNISTSSVLNGYLINQSGTGNVIITNADGLTNITVGTSSGGKSSVAFYYSPTGHSGCLNGNSVIESLVPPTRTPVSLLFGRNPNNNTNLNGHISQLTYYPTRLSNQVLQTLTK
jgi:hypothetical protein